MTTDSKASDVEAREREAFERWVCSLREQEYAPFERRTDGQYYSMAVQNGWTAWLARASQQPSAQWIACSERLPPHKIVIAANSFAVHAAVYERGKWFVAGVAEMLDVTHWMPLPEPPHSPDTERTE